MLFFVDSRQKSVTISTSLSHHEKGQTNHAHHMCTYPENLVKISSQYILIKFVSLGNVNTKKTFANKKHKQNISPSACDVGRAHKEKTKPSSFENRPVEFVEVVLREEDSMVGRICIIGIAEVISPPPGVKE